MFFSISESISLWWIVLAVAISLVVAKSLRDVIEARVKNYPPGPWGVPLLGYLPFLTLTPHVKLYQLSKKYGDVYAIKLLGDNYVVLNSYDIIKDVHLTRGKEFSGVPQKLSILTWLMDNRGILLSEGEEHTIQKNFILQALCQLGMGKKCLADTIADSAQDLVESIRPHNGAPFDPFDMLQNFICHLTCKVLFNKHYCPDDPEFDAIVRASQLIHKTATGIEFLFAQGKLLPWSRAYRQLKPTKKYIHQLFRTFVRNHQKTLDESNPQDFIDICLMKLRQQKDKSVHPNKVYSEDNIVSNSVALFLGGTETIAYLLCWCFHFMLLYPEVQKQVHRELDDVVGRERSPTWLDKQLLPYTVAVLQEIQRVATLVPISAVHCNLEETQLRGYRIDKRTNFIVNLWAANRDPKYWTNPEKFDPSRFLDSSGKYVARESNIPFSIGKRSCPGESVAQMEIYSVFTSILHKFTLTAPDGVTPVDECRQTTFRYPPPYELRAIPR